jgi:LacI family transcriptional regulator
MLDMDWALKRFSETYAGCQKYAAQAGWDCTIDPFAARTMRMSRGSKPYDGCLAYVENYAVDDLGHANVPIVNIRISSKMTTLPGIFPDYEANGVMGAMHLMGRGFRQFGFLAASADLSTKLVLKGFRSELKTAGLSCLARRLPVNKLDMDKPQSWKAFVSGLGAWIDTWPTPIGIFGIRDLVCRYLIDICHSKGLHVPRDVAVIGLGDENVICESGEPSITSIDPGFMLLKRSRSNRLTVSGVDGRMLTT